MNFDEMIKQLQVEYLKSLPYKIMELDDVVSKKDWPTTQSLFHKLKGSGTTYGLPEISQLAAKAENYCKLMPNDIDVKIGISLLILKNIEKVRKLGQSYDLANCEHFKKII